MFVAVNYKVHEIFSALLFMLLLQYLLILSVLIYLKCNLFGGFSFCQDTIFLPRMDIIARFHFD